MAGKQLSLGVSLIREKETTRIHQEGIREAAKRTLHLKEDYQEAYFDYGLIGTGESHAPRKLCVISGERLANDATKPLKLLHHETVETSSPHRDQKAWIKKTGPWNF